MPRMNKEILANPFHDDEVDDSYPDQGNPYLIGGGVWINEYVSYREDISTAFVDELEKKVKRMPQRRHDLLSDPANPWNEELRLDIYLEPRLKDLYHDTNKLEELHVPDANPLGLIVPAPFLSYKSFYEEQKLPHPTPESEDAYIAAIRAFSVFQVESLKALNIVSTTHRHDLIQRLAGDALNRSSMGFNSLDALRRVAPYESEDQWVIYAMVNVVAARSSLISPQARLHAAQVIAQMPREAKNQFFSIQPPLISTGFDRSVRRDAPKGIRNALQARLSLPTSTRADSLFDQYLELKPSLKILLDRYKTEENRFGFKMKSFVDEVVKKRPQEAVLVGLLLLSDEDYEPYGLYLIGELGRKGDSKVFGLDKKYWEYLQPTEE